MVANLSSHKRGWDEQWETFSAYASSGQALKDDLLHFVDEDTKAFNAIMDAFSLPKGSADEKLQRSAAIQAATRIAIDIPFRVMQRAMASFEVIKAMAEIGNPNSVTDAGVGALCARAAVHGAYMNVKVNAGSLKDKDYVTNVLSKGEAMCKEADRLEQEISALVHSKI
jgi:glutamate formiminotransferase/formiminotetrahydrofolate cyclodeaminase